eukprot:scaffold117654_cov40-Prasinocladus_malaysianus.AAC.1
MFRNDDYCLDPFASRGCRCVCRPTCVFLGVVGLLRKDRCWPGLQIGKAMDTNRMATVRLGASMDDGEESGLQSLFTMVMAGLVASHPHMVSEDYTYWPENYTKPAVGVNV